MISMRNRRSGVEDLWTSKRTGQPTRLHGQGKRWRARYVDDSGQEHTKRFPRKRDAEAWLDEVTATLVVGNYVPPDRGRVTFSTYYADWATRQVWESGTVKAMDLAAGGVTFGDVPFSDLRQSHIQTWVKGMQDRGLAPGTIRTRFNNVHTVLKAALRDRYLGADPAEGVPLPRRRRADMAMTIPTEKELRSLLESAEEVFAPFIALCAFAGLRLGEAAALQTGDVDFLRGVIHVRRQVQRANGGQVELRLPKYGSERDVAVPRALTDMLAAHTVKVLADGEPEAWLWPGERGNPWHQNTVAYYWRKAREKAGLEYRLHDLRHFYASGLIASGCDVVTVQRALGHRSATVTLNTYSHLWPDAEDRTRAASKSLMESVLESPAYSLRTGGPVS